MPAAARPRPQRSKPAQTPALLTGTSSEYLGRRPFPRILAERAIVVVMGPCGSGKTSVAKQLANAPLAGRQLPGELLHLDTAQVQNALVERVALRRWPDHLLNARALLLDGPVWLRNRPAAVAALKELAMARAERLRRTLICQSDDDGSVDAFVQTMEPGTMAIIGLRFPKGARGRLRFARRVCDELGIERSAALGADALEPWGYAAVIAHLSEVKTKASASRG